MKGTLIALSFLLLPSVSFAAPLTVNQANSLIAVVQSSTTTPASAFVPLITAFSSISVPQAESLINVVQKAPGVPANAFVDMLLAFTVDPVVQTVPTPTLGATQQTTQAAPQPVIPSPTQSTTPQPTPVVQSVAMTPVITVVSWLINPDNTVTKNPTSIPVSTMGKTSALVYTIDVAPKGDWLVEINYPTKEQGNPQGTVKMEAYPSKNVNDFADRVPGAFYADKPGTYTTTFVASNGTDTATTTITTTVQ